MPSLPRSAVAALLALLAAGCANSIQQSEAVGAPRAQAENPASPPVSAPAQSQPDNPTAFELTILHINDHHSHLDPATARLATTAGGKREVVEVEAGGFPRVVQVMDEIARQRPAVVKLHAGDAITGDIYYQLTRGAADAALMNQACFDAYTLGNHEFGHGDEGLDTFLKALAQGPCATPVLSANVRFGPSSPLYRAFDDGRVRRSVIIERDGQRIGIVGLTTALKTKQSSRPNPDTDLLNEFAVAQLEIDHLRARGVDKVILLTHMGYENDIALAKALYGIDVIVGGDSHTLLGPDALASFGLDVKGPYPTRVRNAEGDLVCVVQAHQYSQVVGELRVGFDAQGRVTHCDGTPHILIGDDFRRADGKPLSAEERAALLQQLNATGAFRVTPPSPAALAALEPYARQKQEFTRMTIAQAARDLCQRRLPGNLPLPADNPLDAACAEDPHVIAHGGDMQQLVAEALLRRGARDFNARISLVNAGAVRTSLPKGPITVPDIYAVLPFQNQVVRLKITGAELKQALEEALDHALTQLVTGAYPYTGGLRFDVDYTRARGERLSNLQVRNEQGQWVPLDPDATYEVATNDFLADGKDGYATLGRIGGERRVNMRQLLADVFLEYVQALPGNPPVLDRPASSDYSTQHFTAPKL